MPGIESELFDLCDLIEPRYAPSFRAASGDMPLRERIPALLDSEGRLPASEISRRLGYSKMTGPVRRSIAELMDEGRVRCLRPGNPRDPRQRICRAGVLDGASP